MWSECRKGRGCGLAAAASREAVSDAAYSFRRRLERLDDVADFVGVAGQVADRVADALHLGRHPVAELANVGLQRVEELAQLLQFLLEVLSGLAKPLELRAAGRRWVVALATRGGNQSWSGLVKRLGPSRCDSLFVHVGDGRRWYIPVGALECASGLTLGGPKYAAYEVAGGDPLPRRQPAEDPVQS